ncbi:hypothetical protein BKA80DRAFT_271207 [Phyllosticta citrichinensis]
MPWFRLIPATSVPPTHPQHRPRRETNHHRLVSCHIYPSARSEHAGSRTTIGRTCF